MLQVGSICYIFFFFKQKTAYEMRISDWSSDVCSSDLAETGVGRIIGGLEPAVVEAEALGRAILQVKLAIVGLGQGFARELPREVGVECVGAIEEAAGVGGACHGSDIGAREIGRASCRERVCQYV